METDRQEKCLSEASWGALEWGRGTLRLSGTEATTPHSINHTFPACQVRSVGITEHQEHVAI